MMHKYFEIDAPSSNVRCKIYFNERPPYRRLVIYGTGFAGHKDNTATARFAEKLLSKHKDAAVLVFNWPAHGDDVRKKLVLSDCNTYLDLVVREARDTFGAESLYAYATSFGGYLFLKYVSEVGNPFEKIALRCPALDMHDVLIRAIIRGDDYEKIMKGKDTQVGFDRKVTVNRALLEDLKENDIRRREYLDYAEDILIMHGTKDEIVPLADSRQFADDQLIEFISVEGADHRFQNPTHMSLANKYAMEFFGLG